jgi:hypothetical protein
MTKKWQHRKCQRCKIEYRPAREAQSYCSRECRRQAAYGRERFKAGTKGRRKRRLEASDNLLGTLVAGSFRNGDFSSSETGCCRPANWIEKLNQAAANEIDRAYGTRERRNCVWIAERSRSWPRPLESHYRRCPNRDAHHSSFLP